MERGVFAPSRSGPKDKAGTVHHYIDHDGLDFVCVQESGVRSDVCPPRLSSIFAATGHHLIVGGAHSANSFDTVVIAIHGDRKISKVFRLPASSRCLAVEIRQGSCIKQCQDELSGLVDCGSVDDTHFFFMGGALKHE
jgi:hypothetical protein